MNNVKRILHLRTRVNEGGRPETKGGATVILTGDKDAPGFVNLTVAYCHPNDTFCKKTGRSQAEKAEVFNVPLRFVAQELGAIQKKIYKAAKIPPIRTNFLPVLLNFLPTGEE